MRSKREVSHLNKLNWTNTLILGLLIFISGGKGLLKQLWVYDNIPFKGHGSRLEKDFKSKGHQSSPGTTLWRTGYKRYAKVRSHLPESSRSTPNRASWDRKTPTRLYCQYYKYIGRGSICCMGEGESEWEASESIAGEQPYCQSRPRNSCHFQSLFQCFK